MQGHAFFFFLNHLFPFVTTVNEQAVPSSSRHLFLDTVVAIACVEWKVLKCDQSRICRTTMTFYDELYLPCKVLFYPFTPETRMSK